MYLIAGLGNPGKQYEATRHNMGFDTIDCLVEKHNIPQGGVKFNAMYGKSIIGGEKAILMKPLSYMNLSGGPIQEMSSYFKIDPETELIVIYDDIDLEPGQLRIRKKGSAGGHNGIKDIIRRLGTEKFIRIRVGVGAKPKDWVWQILCWVIFRTATASLWTRESTCGGSRGNDPVRGRGCGDE